MPTNSFPFFDYCIIVKPIYMMKERSLARIDLGKILTRSSLLKNKPINRTIVYI